MNCGYCNEEITHSLLKDIYMDSQGKPPNTPALIHLDGDLIHIHGAAMVPLGTLTVRGALGRYWSTKYKRLTWRFRKPNPARLGRRQVDCA